MRAIVGFIVGAGEGRAEGLGVAVGIGDTDGSADTVGEGDGGHRELVQDTHDSAMPNEMVPGSHVAQAEPS